MAIEDGRERFMRAVGILADEKDRIKDRLLIAYASQLSRVDAKEDLPSDLLDDFILIRNAVSDADMPYGEGERAGKKVHAMDEEQASEVARSIFSIFIRLHGLTEKG